MWIPEEQGSTLLLGGSLWRSRNQWGGQRIVINKDMQLSYASALLDHLEDLGTDVQSHCRRLRARHYHALSVDV